MEIKDLEKMTLEEIDKYIEMEKKKIDYIREYANNRWHYERLQQSLEQVINWHNLHPPLS